jgi:hypothetical protein
MSVRNVSVQFQGNAGSKQCRPSQLLPSRLRGLGMNVRVRPSGRSNPSRMSFPNDYLRGPSPQANYTERATAACRRS